MTILERLTEEMKKAMKAQDKARLSAIRMLVSAVKYAEIDSPGMGDEKVVEVLRKEAKKRREAVEAYKQGGREAQAKEEENELKIIGEFLPVVMPEAEVREKVKAVLEGKNFNSFGEAMGEAMKTLSGKAEGGLVAKLVKEEFKQK